MHATRPGPGAFAIGGFFLAFPAAVAGGAMALAVLQGVAGVLATPFRNLLPRGAGGWVFLATLAAFVCYAAASSAWSLNPDHGQALRLAAGCACGLLFAAGAGASEGNQRLVRALGAAALLAAMLLLLGEAFADMPLNRMAQPDTPTGLLMRNPARGASVVMCLVWPAVAALAGGRSLQRMAWRALLIGVGVLAFQFDQSGNTIGFAVGLLAYALASFAPRFAIMAIAIALALWLLAAPWVVLHAPTPPSLMAQLPDSWAVRTEIWRFAATQAAQHPLLGLGLDASRTFQQTADLRGLHFNLIPLHPHSASLQIWLETGAVGAALGAIALLAGGWALAEALKHDRVAASGAAGAFAAIGFIANVSYGAWQEWWIATAFAAAAMVAAVRHAREDED
ncbi:MAG TPA: O-antigen ligase family protein [Caulobacterales bacterium]|nr:O-antigen ligase family protein [Caulobacterales bacterium]